MEIDLKQLALFSGLSDAQVSRLEQIGETDSIPAGDYLMREGERSLDVFIILRGRAQVTKGPGNLCIGTLGPGAIVGEIALIERSARSASVQALEELKLFVLRERRFIDRPELADIYPALMRNVSRELCDRVRKQSDTTVKSLLMQVSMARFLVNFLLVSSLYTLGIGVLLRLDYPFAGTTFLSLALLVVFMGVVVRFMFKSGLPMSAYGLTLRNWRPALREALIASAIFMALAVVVKMVVVRTFPSMAGKPLIDFEGSFTDYNATFTWSAWWLYVALYSLFSPVQEFVVRGGIQGALQQFMSAGSEAPTAAHRWMANLIANCVFAAVHTHVSVSFALMAFVPGVLWGWLYSRHPTVVGIAISHIVVGVWCGFVLNLHT